MNDLWEGRVEVEMPRTQTKADTRGKEKAERLMMNRFMLTMLVQQIAPNIHYWDRSTIYSVDKLRRHTGWEPELDFSRSVERTWRWYQAEGLDKAQEFDFGFEDELLKLVESRAR